MQCRFDLAGVYSTYSDSIKLEIRAAKALKKPIIAVELWGAERTSQVVKENADLIVGWNSHSIINAISLETYLHQFDY